MGEVWRAMDTTLDREVAIKVLPAAFTSDRERLARFEREAKVLASLNHPHVAAIHGLHESGGERFLSMELVPGEDLAQRLARGPLPVDEALAVARQIVEALEYAHDHGIVHRDLKPANIKITPQGDVKVLDYGLAKAMSADPSLSGPTSTPTMLPTITTAGTLAGMILGTAAYMSPEQARGRPVDKRADIWAFGCVLWEMLTGSRPFDGETVTDVLAAVVTRDPDTGVLPSATPSAVRRLLARCLDKDARTRLRDIGEARIVLASPEKEEVAGARVHTQAPAVRTWIVWLAAAVLAIAAGAALGRLVLAPRAASPRPLEFDVALPGQRIEMGSLALSPDGSALVFTARDEDGDRNLFVRELDSVQARALPDTRGARHPFWSPDGREIAFFSENRLLRMALDGATARPVGLVPDALGGSWGANDVILVGSGVGQIRMLSASGGQQPTPVTELDPGVEDTHAWPAFLPDGKHFVFLADASTDEGHRIRLGEIGGGPTKILRKAVRSQPVVDPSGRLLLVERGQLVAYPLDLGSGTLGEPGALIAGKVYALGAQHHAPVSCAADTLAFQTGSAEMELVVLDSEGRVIRKLTDPERLGNPAISPDGRRIAFEIFTDSTERLIWVQDIERGVRTALSQRGSMADSSTWGADGETVYFDANPGGKWDVYRKAVSGGGEPEGLASPAKSDITVLDVSPDGRWLLTGVLSGERRNDLLLHDLAAAGGEWIEWLTGPFDESFGSFSPDSRWIAYTSDASGRNEVYVAPVLGGPSVRRFQLSSGGGYEPRFSPDGRKIFYRSARDEWMSADIDVAGDRIDATAPRLLFALAAVDLPWVRNFVDVMPDGSGFIAVHPVGSNETAIRVRTAAH
jgi:Tol biopolymer transport system component